MRFLSVSLSHTHLSLKQTFLSRSFLTQPLSFIHSLTHLSLSLTPHLSLSHPTIAPSPQPTSASAPTTPRSALKSPDARGARKANVRFTDAHDYADTYHREDYDRRGDFDPESAQAEWETEEEAERIRMLEVRWAEFEKSLPPGQKCDERRAFEAQMAAKMAAQAAMEDAAQRERAEKLRKLQEARYVYICVRVHMGRALRMLVCFMYLSQPFFLSPLSLLPSLCRLARQRGTAPEPPTVAATPAAPPAAPAITPTTLTAEPESRSERLRKLQEAR